jgi:heme A synthase
MNGALLAAGAVKLFIGIGLGGLGVVLAWKLLSRLLGGDTQLEDNPAAGLLHGSALISLGLLVRQVLTALFDTIDVFLLRGDFLRTAPRVLLLGGVHIGLSLGLGTALLWFGVWLFNRLTPGIDEVAAVRAGKLGPAMLLGAILITLALLAAPGLEALLAGLIPYPQLPEGLGIPHS